MGDTEVHGAVRDLVKSFRVAEIFGPTIQGEGRRIGTPCHFIRFGGCDYRCVWCDSPHAVLPELVAQLPQKTEKDIWREVRQLSSKALWVVYSGGNPALLDLSLLTAYLIGDGYSVMVETQGTVWRDWLGYVDEVCVSPKPPSSQNPTRHDVLKDFLAHFSSRHDNAVYLKVVVFDDEDYYYAQWVHKTFPQFELFLSVGNEDPFLPTVSNPEGKVENRINPFPLSKTRSEVLDKMVWLMEKLANDQSMRRVRVLPQMHVLSWGNARGR